MRPVYVAIALVAALLLHSVTRSHAQAIPPGAPSNVVVDYAARTITWSDAPDNNEDGYRIRFTIIGRRENGVELTAPKDATSVAIPDDAPRLYCGARLAGEIVAFNSAGESPAVPLDAPGVCPDPPSPIFDFSIVDETTPGPDANVVVITWTPIEGGVTMLIDGSLTAVPQKVPASCNPPFSDAPIQHVDLGVEVAIEDRVYRIELPALPAGERYSIIPEPLDVTVLDRYGEPLAGFRRSKIVEGCGLDVGQPPPITLPSTGSPNTAQSSGSSAAAAAVGVAAMAALGGGLHLYRRAFRAH
jgi:hypothetical protein